MRGSFQTVVSPLSLSLTIAWVISYTLLHLCINEGGRKTVEGKGRELMKGVRLSIVLPMHSSPPGWAPL